MPRLARAVAPGVPHHVTQRGNFQQRVFGSDADREAYLAWLAHYAQLHGTRFWAWCLMSNHVHFVAVPLRADSLAKTFKQAHHRHAQHVNKHARRHGHLWQGRFFSCALGK